MITPLLQMQESEEGRQKLLQGQDGEQKKADAALKRQKAEAQDLRKQIQTTKDQLDALQVICTIVLLLCSADPLRMSQR